MKIIKTHDRDFFYKYANYDTAINILGNLEVRWSSPLLFNDPFDTQVGIHLDFTSEELIRSTREEIGKMIFAEEEPSLANDNPYSLLLSYQTTAQRTAQIKSCYIHLKRYYRNNRR